MMFKIMALPWAPYISKVELKSNSKIYYEFEGWFKEIWLELQVQYRSLMQRHFYLNTEKNISNIPEFIEFYIHTY